MRKTVTINSYDFDALIDTGSTITLIRESAHQILGKPTLNPTKINLFSFEKRLVEKEIQCKSLTEKILIVNALTESNDNPKTSMSTKEREIKPRKRKIKKLKSSGRNANKTSDSDENQALAKEKNDLLRQIDFLNSIILDTKLKEPNKSLLTTFWIFFRCGQFIFRMADCEVEGAIAGPRSIAPVDSFEKKREGNVPDGKRSSERMNMRTKQNPLRPQGKQTHIDRAVIFL
ncbi:hypothetical protein TNCV_2693641 [Trichonephila clavipes]|nr:hypothetical protein TNCV_2693641 [Trichonephila clavipes]